MAKILTYVIMLTFIFAGMGILFGVSGTATSQLISALGSADGFKAGDLWSIVFGSAAGIIATLGLGAVLVIGLYRGSPVTQTVLAGFAGILVGWITGDLITLMNVINSGLGGDFAAVGMGIKVLTFSLLAGAIISGIQWWAGQDL